MGGIFGLMMSRPQAIRAATGVGFAVLVGQALGPADGARPELAMTGAAGKRIASLCGLTYPKGYVSFFDRANVLDYYPGPASGGEGDCFPAEEARVEADRMTSLLDGRLVILCGRQVARAFRLGEAPLFVWNRVSWEAAGRSGRFAAAVAPHPSGVSRWWNKPANVAAARAFFGEVVAKAGREGR